MVDKCLPKFIYWIHEYTAHAILKFASKNEGVLGHLFSTFCIMFVACNNKTPFGTFLLFAVQKSVKVIFDSFWYKSHTVSVNQKYFMNELNQL